ncbi:hypothetical protein ACUN0C_18990 [Faunimonas sp. B44]|uniref:hypothetical protein n=1 Tax=Faunimonas sp. B44 TaxID=3461493 RepID=UPI004044BC4F
MTRIWKSPSGAEIVGTLERLMGCANINDITDDGEPVYSGDTKIWWDEQRTVLRDGQMLFVDENGDEWIFAELKVEEVEE